MKTGKIDAEYVALAQFLEKRCNFCTVFVHFYSVKSIDSVVYGFAILQDYGLIGP